MGLFDRNDYDRGYRGRGNWSNWGQGSMRYDRDVNRGFGATRYRTDVDRTPTGYTAAGSYDRDLDRVPYGMQQSYREGNRWGAYDRNYGYGAAGMTGYDRDYGYGYSAYDRDYKSRLETDAGDPFGDRTAHTPIRMINGEFENRTYDRDFAARRYDRDLGPRYGTMGYGYDRDYNQAISDEPYYGRRYGATGYDRGFARDRDRGWF